MAGAYHTILTCPFNAEVLAGPAAIGAGRRAWRALGVRSRAIVIRARQALRHGVELVEPLQHVFDVARQVLGPHALRGPAERGADAGEEIDIVDARRELW